MSDSDEFAALLDAYLEPASAPNPAFAKYQIIWIKDDPRVGALHMQEKHKITTAEVEEVIFETPPDVEAVRHPEFPERVAYWGATRQKRWMIVICEIKKQKNYYTLSPITAFEPDGGYEYFINNFRKGKKVR